MKRFFNIAIVFACFAGLYGFAGLPDDVLSKIKQHLDKWVYEQPVEKVYLQLDKPYYAAGDDIWFKAYVVSGVNHAPSIVSAILNVDLIDDRDSIIRSDKLPLRSGTANGDFALPDTLHAGRYRIRAYTSYMRNAGSEYFFNRAIAIINPLTQGDNSLAKSASATPGSAGKPDVQFFPESGYLVNGIATKVAFKAVAPDGLGAPITGTIIDSRGRTIAQLNTLHLGMGIIEVTPVAGLTYQARVTFADGTASTIPLPVAVNKGAVLNITDNGPQNIAVRVTASAPLVRDEPHIQFNLVAQSNGKVCYSAITTPGKAVFTAVIPKSAFPSGITQFTLFSATGEPLNERLVFIRNPDQLNLALATDNPVYAPRQKVHFYLDAKDGGNKPVAGNFSVSVVDETRVPVTADNENNIIASLLLTADLRGFVEQPAWYFNRDDKEAAAALDVLMLTQGYHRFEWRQLGTGDLPRMQYHPEASLQVSGTVVMAGGSKPVANATVNLYDLDSIQYSRDTVTDDRGRFVFKNLTFDDSVRFIIQARTSKNKKDVDIKIDKPVPPNILKGKDGPDFELTDNVLLIYTQSSRQLYDMQRKFGLGNHVISLKEVVIREKKELLKYSANLNGPGNADQIVQGKDLREMGCIDIADCLQGRLLGVVFRNGVPYSTRSFRPMQVLVDGMYVDARYLNSIDYNNVQGIEVLRNVEYTSIYGSRGANGVLLVTTRHGGDNDVPEPIFGKGITTYYPKGYYKARVFYSPQYDQPKTNKQLADARTTIFWKPNVLTGSDGKTTFDFFNAGSKGVYRVVLEGIDNNGRLGRAVYRYKVE